MSMDEFQRYVKKEFGYDVVTTKPEQALSFKKIFNSSMNREEAFIAMQQGKKIRHMWFEKNEFLFIRDGIMYTEEGYVFGLADDLPFGDGWEMRKGGYWEDGWSVVG